MSDVALSVLDGSLIRPLRPSLPHSAATSSFTAEEVLRLAESEASSALFGLALPESLTSAALRRIGVVRDVGFLRRELGREEASKLLSDYLVAIADQLRDDPLAVSVLDGNAIRLILEDEDDFAMVAENLFTDLDTEDKGKISKSKIRDAVINMGVEMGVPPPTEFPQLDEIILNHDIEEKEELGQAQFAQVLQPILQEIADYLSKKPIIIIQNIKITNGSKLKKTLADEKQLNDVIEKIWKEGHSRKDEIGCGDLVRIFIEKNGKELGLPASKANEAVALLYDVVFATVDRGKKLGGLEKTEFAEIVKDIFQQFAEQLEANPVYQDCDGDLY